MDRFGEPGQSVWVAPEGTADGEGTPHAPLDLHTAVAFGRRRHRRTGPLPLTGAGAVLLLAALAGLLTLGGLGTRRARHG